MSTDTPKRERPILFNAPMIRALLAGAKTQTRRIVKPQPETTHDGEPYWFVGGYRVWGYRPASAVPLRAGGNPLLCPYGQPGDRLWVRETWAHGRHAAAANCVEDGPFVYAADGEFAARERLNPRWVPGIHMFRWASRITLDIAAVRVERLQDISEADALAEGIVSRRIGTGDARTGCRDAFGLACDNNAWAGSAVQAYQHLWEQINGPGSWDANPFVWVVEFRRTQEHA